MQMLSTSSHRVSRHHGLKDFFGSDRNSLVMYGLSRSTRLQRHWHQVVIAYVSDAKVGKGGRQSYLLTE